MRNVVLCSLATLLLLASCKPEKSVNPEKVRPEDAKAMSSAISVWHGVRTNGNPPAASTNPNAPRLDVSSNNQSVRAVAGRYAIILPQVISGSVKGYNVQVNGATDYFKVDYSKPRITGRMANFRPGHHNRALSRGLRIDSTGNGTLDSALVIVIPSTVQPGQFCITYWAYDSSGNVSNPITTCITVTSFGGDASVGFVTGTWHITGAADDTTAGWEPVYGVGDTLFHTGYCINGHIVDTFGVGGTPVNVPEYIYKVTQADLSFASNGGMSYAYEEQVKTFDYVHSSCSNFVFDTDSDGDHIQGAWSYTASNQTMVLIFEFDDMGQPVAEAYEYKFKKITDHKFYLYDRLDDSWLRFEK